MERKQVIIWSVVLVAAFALIAYVIFGGVGKGEPEPEGTPEPLPTINIGVGPTATPVPAPDQEPGSGEHAEGNGDLPLGDWPNADLTAFTGMASNTVIELSTYSSDETVEARTARVSAAAGAESPVAGFKTKLALERYEPTVDWSARTGIIGEPYATATEINHDGKTLTLEVFAQYWGSYGTPETRSQQASGTWVITASFELNETGTPVPVRIESVAEPKFKLE